MNTTHPVARDHTVVVTRVADTQWRAVEDDRTVGRGETTRRPDGRLFASVDAWHDAVFDRLAAAMLADLPGPVHTVVDEADLGLTANWYRAGLTTRRREWEYRVPTDPRVTGLGEVLPPDGVRLVPVGAVRQDPLSEAYRAIRDDVEAGAGWASMPAEVLAPPFDPSRYAAAATPDGYAGLVRIVRRNRHARIGLIAVRPGRRRRGIARALLSHVLGALHRTGTDAAWAEVDETNAAATALFDGVGARRAASTLELVRP